jgi:hypothetical protein
LGGKISELISHIAHQSFVADSPAFDNCSVALKKAVNSAFCDPQMFGNDLLHAFSGFELEAKPRSYPRGDFLAM